MIDFPLSLSVLLSISTGVTFLSTFTLQQDAGLRFSLYAGYDPKEHNHPDCGHNDDTDMDSSRCDEKGTCREQESQRGLKYRVGESDDTDYERDNGEILDKPGISYGFFKLPGVLRVFHL